jgi:hypothetical protein
MNPTITMVPPAPRPSSALKELHQKSAVAFPLVLPVTGTDEIIRAWESFNDLKLRLLDKMDFVAVRGENFAKKSAFRKLALAFGISCEVIREDHIEFTNGTKAFLVTVKAYAPNGRFMTACGSCHSNERKFNKESDIRAMAQTRATNRAIADLVGWSAPSAEEMACEETHSEEIVLQSSDASNLKKQNDPMTESQHDLLVKLINEKTKDQGEREIVFHRIETFSKQEASHAIKNLLKRSGHS